MKKYSFNPRPPITIELLVDVCKSMKGMSRSESYELGEKNGIAKHIVESLRQVLGYTDPNKYKRLQNDERELIVEEYENEDVSLYELARRHGIRYNAVRSILQSRDVTIRNPNKWTKRQEVYLLREHKRGVSAQKIGEAMGKSKKSVLGKIYQLKKTGSL